MGSKQLIFLIGMRGAGKTSVGRELSQLMSIPLLDCDTQLEKRAGASINFIVEEFGWEVFRKLETETLQALIGENKHSRAIISTGGGIVCTEQNIGIMQSSGVVILLTASSQVLAKRIANSVNRPSLTGRDFCDELEDVWSQRKKAYFSCADLVMSSENRQPENIADELYQRLLSLEYVQKENNPNASAVLPTEE